MEKVLLFNVDIFKINKIQLLLAPIGVEVIVVKKNQQDNTIGNLLSEKAFYNECANPFDEELMVIYNLDEQKLDYLLAQLRAQCPIRYKAVVTKHNFKWTAIALINELREEERKISKNG